MNTTFIEQWLLASNKFDALNQRERLMVFGAALLLTYTLINIFLLSPLEITKQKLLTEISTDQSLALELQQQVDLYKNKPPLDPDAQNKERIAALQAQIRVLESSQNQLNTTLISPDKMPALLRDLLSKNGKLKLIALNTLPTQNLITQLAPPSNNNVTPNTADQVNEPESTIFKHGVEITIEGRYLDLLDYVSSIEKMHWHVLWNNAELNTKIYPNNQLKLTVYTLSLDKTWLSI